MESLVQRAYMLVDRQVSLSRSVIESDDIGFVQSLWDAFQHARFNYRSLVPLPNQRTPPTGSTLRLSQPTIPTPFARRRQECIQYPNHTFA